jgi:phage terminase large subunit
LSIQPLPRVFRPLFQPYQFKGAHGGRGGGKSHLFAGLLVASALQTHIRAACVREVQDSLRDSSKQIIEDKINAFGVAHKFKITDREIIGPHDSLFVFRGLQRHTASRLKSLEGFNRAWYEEAQALSKSSVETALNTFRVEGTEQWFSWNPEREDDPVDVMFRENTAKPWGLLEADDPDFVCVEVNYPDNPYFPSPLQRNMQRDKLRDPEKYNHIWLGGYRRNSDSQVFQRPKHWKVEAFDPPAPDVAVLGGADWGYSIDPTVLVLCFIKGHTLYVWREAWGTQCGPDRRPALFDKIDPDWSVLKASDPNWKSIARRVPIIADSSLPEAIDSMQRAGFSRIRAAVKGPNSVEEGITFLQGYDIVVHPDCINVIRELTRYSFKVDPKSQAVLPVLEDKDNHTIDSLRYAVENVRRASHTTSQEMNF